MTLDLSPDTYQRLLAVAGQCGAPIETVAENLLTEQLADVHLSGRDRVTAVLRAAGLLMDLCQRRKNVRRTRP